MAFAWTKEHDLKLIFALQQVTGVEYLDNPTRNDASIDWSKVNLAAGSWPKAFTLDTLKIRYFELLQRWKASTTSRGTSLFDWRSSLIDGGIQVDVSENEERKWLSLLERLRNDRNWRVRVTGVEPSLEVEFLYQLSKSNRQLFLEYLSRGVRLYQPPLLSFDSPSLLGALGRLLDSSIPEHLQYISSQLFKKDTRKGREMLLKCLEDSRSLGKLQIHVLDATEKTSRVYWRDTSVSLILLSRRSDASYNAVLRVEMDGEGMAIFSSPIAEYVFHFRVDGIMRLFLWSDPLKICERVDFEFEGKSIQISVPPTVHQEISHIIMEGVAPAAQQPEQRLCSVCNLPLDSLSVEDQAKHVQSCSEKQATEQQEKATAVLARIDERLKTRGLERNTVPSDGLCYLRALLLAQGKPSDQDAVLALFMEIWNFSKKKAFSCLSLTDKQRQELGLIEDPREHLSHVSYSTATASNDSAFEAFWNVVSYFAAPVIGKDIYLVSQEASHCTVFSRSESAPSSVPLVAVSTALSSSSSEGVALLHLSEPVLHIDWLSLMPPVSTIEEDLEGPSSPMTITPRPQPLPLPEVLSLKEQLNSLLLGKTLSLSSDGWWQSLESVLTRFSSKTGKIVWYSKKTPEVWYQHPLGELPMDCPLPETPTVAQWLAWREKAATLSSNELTDLFYLIDVDLSDQDLEELTVALPILGLLDDRTSIYSLNAYLRKVCPTLAAHMPDLRPRLYFSPGLVPGAVSTSLHLDGLGHMLSYHWSLPLGSDEARNFVDIYPSESELGSERFRHLRSIVGAAMSLSGFRLPHSVGHDSIANLRHGCDEYQKLAQVHIFPKRTVELRPGEMLILPAGQPHAFKKWSKSIQVSLAGDISWLGRNRLEASEALGRMMEVERSLTHAYCLPELSMVACLLCVSKRSSELAQEHLSASFEHLKQLLTEDSTLLAQLLGATPSMSIAGVIEDHQLWTCSTCKTVVLNTIVWCQVADEAYCPACYQRLSLKKRGNSKRSRGSEDFVVSFRFDHPSTLLTLLSPPEPSSAVLTPAMPTPIPLSAGPAPPPAPVPVPASPSPTVPSAPAPILSVSPTPVSPPVLHALAAASSLAAPLPAPSPAPVPPSAPNLLETLTEVISLGRIDDSHALCKLAFELEKDKSLSKLQRERLLLLNHDLPRFCHTQTNAEQCPLVATESQREQTYEEEFRRKYRCSNIDARGKCNKVGTWSRPLHSCPGETHGNPFMFHLDCAGYADLKVPSGTKLLCPSCLKSKREEKPVSAFRAQHIWETLHAQRELDQKGYRCILIPPDGLCFFSVLYMLSHSSPDVPKASIVIDWLSTQLSTLLLGEIRSRPLDDPLRAAETEVVAWSVRSMEEWTRGGWDSDDLDLVCSVLPDLLCKRRVITFNVYRYAYDSSIQAGSWFDRNGTKIASLPPGTRFAIYHSQTPVAHYTLLERQDHDTLPGLNDGALLGSDTIGDYFCRILAKDYASAFYLDPGFYTKLSACKTLDDSKALFRWFKKFDRRIHEKIFIPIHQPRHWCLAVLDLKLEQVEYYDSYNKKAKSMADQVAKALREFFDLLWKERGYNTSTLGWRIIQPSQRPFQENGIDCGVFVCAYARCRSIRPFNVFDFKAEDIPRIRQEMKTILS